MRLRHIEVFHAVYSTGSVSKAARDLNVSQPSVSKVLRHAEDQLGYRLFERVKGRLLPTDEAHMLFQEVDQVYGRVGRLQRFAANLGSKKSGHIRIACAPTLGENLLPKAISSFRKNNPEATFTVESLHFDQVIAAILEEQVDVGLVFEQVARKGFHQKVITEGEFVCLYNPDDLQPGSNGRLSFEQLDGRDFIRINPKGPLGRRLEAQLTSSDINMKNVVTVEAYSTARELASLGVGVTIVDAFTARALNGSGLSVSGLYPSLRFAVTLLSKEERPLNRLTASFCTELELISSRFLIEQ